MVEKNKTQIKREVVRRVEEKRMIRMGYFDKKITALQNQCEIIDVKMEIDDYYSSQVKK